MFYTYYGSFNFYKLNIIQPKVTFFSKMQRMKS